MNRFVFIACVAFTCFFAHQALAFSGVGSGTALDPYQIATCEQLQEMNDDLAADYELMNDIDCSDTVNWNGGIGFFAIGGIDFNGGAEFFTGTLDGNGYNVTDLFINSEQANIGLIGAIDGDGGGVSVSNIGVVGGSVNGDSNVGCLVGYIQVTNSETVMIDNTHATCDVNSKNGGQAGGLIGYIMNAAVVDSYATGDVTNVGAPGGGTSYGGFVGLIEKDTTITNSYATGDVLVPAEAAVGGFVGLANGSGIVIEHSYATGNVSIGLGSGGVIVGGFIGLTGNSISISNAYSTGNVTGDVEVHSFGTMIGTVVNVYSIGLVTGTDAIGGLLGNAAGDPTVTSSYWDTEISNQLNSPGGGTPKLTTEMKQQATYVGWDFNTIWNIDEGESYPYFSFSPGFTRSESTQSVTEAGGTDTFTVVLTAATSDDVMLSITSSDTDEATVSPATLTFTSSNWDTAQTVTVTGVDDTSDDGDQSTTITIAVIDAQSSDAFDMLPNKTVTVTTTDNDAPAVASPSSSSNGVSAQGRFRNLVSQGKLEEANKIVKEFPNQFTAPVITLQLNLLQNRLTRIGTIGPHVKQLQNALNERGAQPSLVPDGHFGPKTLQAVKAFQTKNGLVPDGIVGPKTLEKLTT